MQGYSHYTNVLLKAVSILEAARSLGCEVVFSEDLSDGQDYGGVLVQNPFAG